MKTQKDAGRAANTTGGATWLAGRDALSYLHIRTENAGTQGGAAPRPPRCHSSTRARHLWTAGGRA